MTTRAADSVQQALALYGSPARLNALRAQRLPDDVGVVLRIAAGEAESTELAARQFSVPQQQITEAAVFYVQQVMLASADPYRVLGVNRDGPDARIREHYRWLVRWLHPDRNADEWDSVYVDRVNKAWHNLRTPERRQAHDDQLEKVAPQDEWAVQPEWAPRARLEPASVPALIDPPPGKHWARVLPAAAIGSLALVALGLAATYLVRTSSGPAVTRTAEATLPAVPPAESPISEEQEPPLVAAAPDRASSTPAQVSPVPAPAPGPAPEVVDTSLTAAAPPPLAAMAQAPSVSESPPPPSPPPERSLAGESRARSPAPLPASRPASPPAALPQPPALVATAPRRVTETPVQAAAVQAPATAPVETSVAAAAATATAAEPAPAVPASPGTSPEEVRGLIGEFSTAYASGDLDSLMALFALENAGNRAAIEAQYRDVFRGSQRRWIRIRNVSSFHDSGTDVVLGNYELMLVKPNSERAELSRGDIRLELRRSSGRLLIAQVKHVQRGG